MIYVGIQTERKRNLHAAFWTVIEKSISTKKFQTYFVIDVSLTSEKRYVLDTKDP